MNTERRNALTGLMQGMTDYIPHRDLAVALGFTVTDVYNELRGMEIDGLVERLAIPSKAYQRGQDQVAWRLKQAK